MYTVKVLGPAKRTIEETIVAMPIQKNISPYFSGSITDAKKNQKTAVMPVPIISEIPMDDISLMFFLEFMKIVIFSPKDY